MCRHLGALRKTTAREIHCDRVMQRGATVVEYLMLTAVVAGIGVPLVLNFFGEPLLRSFEKNRETLVQFIAQDRKQSVPYPWFSQERPADIDVSESPEIASSEVGKSPDIAESPEIRVNEVGSSKVGSGGMGAGGAGGTGPAGGGLLDSERSAKTTGAPSPSTSSDDSSLSDSFFKGEGSKTASRDEKAEEEGALYGRAGEVAAETKTSEEIGVAGKEGSSEKGGEDKGRSLSETKQKQGALMAEIEERERLKQSTFSWGFLLKILILLLIIFLILLILLSNMRRR